MKMKKLNIYIIGLLTLMLCGFSSFVNNYFRKREKSWNFSNFFYSELFSSIFVLISS